MDPLTHALTSYALVRAALPKPARSTTLLVVAAGVAPDVDTLSELVGNSAALRFSGVVTHSIFGACVVALLSALCFHAWQRRRAPTDHSFASTLGLVMLSVALHVLLDLTTCRGVALLWPLRSERTAWNFTLMLDPILLSVLLLTLLLPGLFRMISEEIGARTEGRAGRRWAMAALAFVALFSGARAFLHQRAETLVGASRYHDRAVLHSRGFADSANPFQWLGVAETEASIEEVEVPVGTGAQFNPDRSRTYYKPEASPTLEIARKAPGAAEFLALAKFPSASVERTADGFRVEFRDIGFSALRNLRGYYFVEVDLDTQSRVVRDELGYARERRR